MEYEIPSYASKKYINTVNILKRASKLFSLSQTGHEYLGPFDTLRFQKTLEQIQLKEKVLGFLEAYTNGTVHSQQIPLSETRELIDILLAESPSAVFSPKNNQTESYRRMLDLRSHIDNAANKELAKQELLRVFYIESTPSINLDDVENIVLAGGGAKALSLAGAIRGLEKNKRSSQIKRVAGTSGGAIVAMAYSLGYDADELDRLILDNHFGLFTLGSRFDNNLLNQWSYHLTRDNTDSKLHVLSDNSIAHKYHKELINSLCDSLTQKPERQIKALNEFVSTQSRTLTRKDIVKFIDSQPSPEVAIQRIVARLSQDEILEIDGRAMKKTIEKFGGNINGGVKLYKTPQQGLNNALRHASGIDLVRAFFSDVIYEKLKNIPVETLKNALYTSQGKGVKNDLYDIMNDLRNINFKQLHTLSELAPSAGLKELHISMSIQKERLSERFTSKGYDPFYHVDASHMHGVFSNMPIAEAVRVSMNLPPIYPQYKFEINGKRYFGSDGGIKSNVSLNTFDTLYAPEKTIGVIYKTRKELSSSVDVKRILSASPSRSKVETTIKELESKDRELKMKQKQFDVLLASSDLRPESRLEIQCRRNNVLDARRQINGRLAEQKDALYYIDYTQSGTLKKWLSEPLGEIGRLLGKYLDGKSHDDLMRTKNLKRLTMVNTHGIETWDFKMTDDLKEAQIKNGEKAMDSLLNGAYCLENHFFYHHVKSMQQQIAETGLSVMLENEIDDTKLLPYHEVTPTTRSFEEDDFSPPSSSTTKPKQQY